MKKCIIVLTLFVMGCPQKHIPDPTPTEEVPVPASKSVESLIIDQTILHKTIATGAKFDVFVFHKDDTPAILDSAQFSNQEIAVVSQIDGNRVTVEGLSGGSARLIARTKDGIGQQDLKFSKAIKTSLIHFCQKTSELRPLAHYVAGTKDVAIRSGVYDDNRQLSGYGFRPFDINAGAQFREPSDDENSLRIDLGNASGQVSLTSTIDDNELILSIVEEDDFDGIEIDEEITASIVSVSKKTFAKFHPTVEGIRVCSVESKFEFKTTTPEICDVQLGTALPGWHWMRGKTGLLSIEGKAAGDCEITVSYPDAMLGAQQFETTITIKDD